MLVAVGETATAAGKETGQRSCGGATSVSSAPSGQVLRVRQIAFAALVLLGVIPAWSVAQMVPGATRRAGHADDPSQHPPPGEISRHIAYGRLLAIRY